MIITNEALKNASSQYTFDDLVNHRISRGLSATIVTTEWIYANYDGTRPDETSDDQTRIRNFIIDAYCNWGTTYVLLGGDGDGADVGGESGDNIIPARGFYIQAGEETDYNMPADMYYGCLDGSFDHDGDGLYGEPTDGQAAGEVDLFAEVYTGRAPVDSDGELSNLVKKTIEYETMFLKKALMVGQKMCNNPLTGGGDYKDEIKDGSSNHGYTTVGFPGNWDVDTLYDRDGTWVVDDLISRMNDGRALINHLGHGSNTSAMLMNNSIVDGLQNSHSFCL